MATPQRKNHCPGGHEIYNLGRPFFGHHYYLLSLSDLCLGVKKKIFKGIMHFHYITLIWPCPSKRNPYPGGHEIYNDSSLVIITIQLFCLNHAPE